MINKDDLTQEQLDILEVSKTNNRILISAPPGCGKTTLILFLLEQWQELKEIKPYRSVLILSFSTSASNKLKLELQEKATQTNNSGALQYFLKEKVTTTNYHGLCRRILFKQRKHLLDLIKRDVPENTPNYEKIVESLNKIQKLSGVSNQNNQYDRYVDREVKDFLEGIDRKISNNLKFNDVNKDIVLYAQHMIRHFLPHGVISFNGIIILVLWLFMNNTQLRQNYLGYFTHIVVDEYQDTNILGYWLLHMLIGEQTKFYAFGDELQQLYVFIGAIPQLFDRSKQKLKCIEKELTINQRYKNNPKMLKISEYIRSVAKGNPIVVEKDHKLDSYSYYEDIVDYFQDKYQENTCCVMFADRFSGHDNLLLQCRSNSIDVFYAMFTDTGYYQTFHQQALEKWQSYSNDDNTIITLLSRLSREMKGLQNENNQDDWDSLLVLLDLLKNSFKSTGEWGFFEDFEQFQIVEDILSNETLKQFLDKVKNKVIVSTIHAAKGQQWEYTVTKFSNRNLDNYSDRQNISLINVGLSRASIEAKVFITGQQASNEFIGTISKLIDEEL